jgi:Na+/melibiose symporter-like transporter
VLLPFVAKFDHEDHGPLRLLAVQYMLSFGAVSLVNACFFYFVERALHHPLSWLANIKYISPFL